MRERVAVRRWLGVAAAGAAVQAAASTYPDHTAGARVFWLAVAFLLLFGILRSSRIAWALFMISSLMGVFIYGSEVLSGGRLVVATMACAVQAAAVLMPGVRAWTHRSAVALGS